MKVRLDTHVVPWAAGEPDKPSDVVRALLADEGNGLFFSVASISEVVKNRGLGRDDFRVDPLRLRRLLVTNGCSELHISSDHALAVENLPPLHRDPFDRILLAQARAEGICLLTADVRVAHYGEGTFSA